MGEDKVEVEFADLDTGARTRQVFGAADEVPEPLKATAGGYAFRLRGLGSGDDWTAWAQFDDAGMPGPYDGAMIPDPPLAPRQAEPLPTFESLREALRP